MLAAHGATYLTLKTEGPVHDRSENYALLLWLVLCPLGVIISVETWYVRPDILGQAVKNPFSWLGLIAVATAAVTLITGLRKRLEFRAFIGSTFLIAGLLGTGRRHIPGDAFFNAGPGEFRNGLRRCVQSWRPSGGTYLVAGCLHHGCLLLRLHFSTLCRQSKYLSRQSGLLLSHRCRTRGWSRTASSARSWLPSRGRPRGSASGRWLITRSSASPLFM